jgi:hypothetical protein
MLNTKLRVAELDFDKIKSNLKLFLKDQSEFSDYDFDGSGLSVLLDILAYNTHYNSYYLNMVANEMFLDSVTQRDSAVSIAKHLGYITKSATASTAIVTLEITTVQHDLPATISIPQYSKFTTTIDNNTYVFYTLDAYIADEYSLEVDCHVFTLKDVNITEGTRGSVSYVVNESGFEEKYVIPAKFVDTSTIVISVKEASHNTVSQIYSLYNSVDDLKATSNIYFLQEVEDEQYEVYFGDGVLGKKVTEGNLITIDYLTTNGAIANGVGVNDGAVPTFLLSNPLAPAPTKSPTTVVSVQSPAVGGVTSPESIDSIKFNAPKSFQTQGRAVTKRDYKSIILSEYSNADSVIVWGGEDNDPVDYGSVYISIKPVTGLIMNSIQKEDLKSMLDKYKVLSIIPKIVDPDYLFVELECEVRYDSGISLNPADTSREKVLEVIKEYNKSYLSNFESILRYSQLVGMIDGVDDAILSNSLTMKLKKRVQVPAKDLGVDRSHELLFNNKVEVDVTGYKAGTTDLGGEISVSRFNFTKNVLVGSFESDPFHDDRLIIAAANSSSAESPGDTVKVVDNANGGLDLVKTKDNTIYNPNLLTEPEDYPVQIAPGTYGSISYETGKVKIDRLNVGKYGLTKDSEYLYFRAKAVETDVFPKFNQIILVLDADIKVTMMEDLV